MLSQSRPILSSQPVFQSYTLFPPTIQSLSTLSTTSSENDISSATSDEVFMVTVRVPSTAHVAQIVGKQGAKIKQLRQKSKTYIQTPTANEEPIFTITGDKRDVISIRDEIMKTVAHFNSVQEEKIRKLNESKRTPGSQEMLLEVPMYLVGLIVGKNGNNIRDVQQKTGTYIETPKRDDKPIFKITGPKAQLYDALNRIRTHARDKSNLNFDFRHKSETEMELYKNNDE